MTRLLVALFVMLCTRLAAQIPAEDRPADSVNIITEGDTILIESYASRYDPRKALLFSAVVPGLGQAYNKKYWKIPLVYGGGFGLWLIFDFYQDQYKDYKSELFYILEHETAQSPGGFTETQLRPAIDRARRERDFLIILLGALYVLQIVDAHVDAHLKEFDVNPNLKVSFQPFLDNNTLTGSQKGLSVALKF